MWHLLVPSMIWLWQPFHTQLLSCWPPPTWCSHRYAGPSANQTLSLSLYLLNSRTFFHCEGFSDDNLSSNGRVHFIYPFLSKEVIITTLFEIYQKAFVGKHQLLLYICTLSYLIFPTVFWRSILMVPWIRKARLRVVRLMSANLSLLVSKTHRVCLPNLFLSLVPPHCKLHNQYLNSDWLGSKVADFIILSLVS